jgi:deoxyribonuclease V
MNLFEYTYDLLKQIPDGKVSTYGAVARALGDSLAARAVGRMMNQNQDPDEVPCYKIVHSDGRLGGFGRGIDDKIRRLKEDNIMVEKGRIENFHRVLFDNFSTNYPLKELRQEQIKLREKVTIKDDFSDIQTVAGIDVAYPKDEFKDACVACVIMDYHSNQMVEQTTSFGTTYFPYIPSYLFYRESPLVKTLVNEMNHTPSIYIIDGNGILHPFGFGLASHIGITLDIPTIGVAKRLLCGRLENHVVKIDDNAVGYAVYTSNRAKNPIYVSSGHKVSPSTSMEIVKQVSRYKIPEPLRQAHLLANQTLRSKTW